MKTLFLAVLLFTNASFGWEKITSCDGDLFVIDRQVNEAGQIEYQTVFRKQLVRSMLEQGVIQLSDLNSLGELIRSSNGAAGMLSTQPPVGFQLTNAYNRFGHYSVIFHSRQGQVGNYVFNHCRMRELQ